MMRETERKVPRYARDDIIFAVGARRRTDKIVIPSVARDLCAYSSPQFMNRSLATLGMTE